MRREHAPFLLCFLAIAGGCSSASSSDAVPALPPLPCPAPATFDLRATPKSVRHVAKGGDDTRGDGSAARPFLSIQRALQGIGPGVAIHIHAGKYEGEVTLNRVRGTADAPIWIMGAPGETRPTITGGNQGIYLTQPQYVVLDHLEISYTSDNGLNVDDGGRVADPDAARFLVFRDLDMHDTGQQPRGVADCLKMSGVNDFVVVNSRFARCGSPEGGSVGVGGVGTHGGVVYGNSFTSTGFGGVQFKGGSTDIEITGNRFEAAGFRAANLGGSTSIQFFRPPLSMSAPSHEAARIRMTRNVVLGGESAVAFVGCVDCAFARNTVANPSRWAARILQETVTLDTYSFAASTSGVIADNLFYFRRGSLNFGEDLNVGANTQTESFTLSGNMWYAHDTPDRSRPILPRFKGTRTNDVIGVRPAFVAPDTGDFRVPENGAAFPPGAPASCAVGPRDTQ